VAAHLDLDGYAGLALFADRDLLVVALDGGSAWQGLVNETERIVDNI
jgi:hypothetical protein